MGLHKYEGSGRGQAKRWRLEMPVLLCFAVLAGCGGNLSAVNAPRSIASQRSFASHGKRDLSVLVHSKTYEQVTDGIQNYNDTFGWNNWQYVQPYIDLAYASPGSPDQVVRAGGISTVVYVDPNLCSGSFPQGPNQYATPDCATFPASSFYHQPGYTDRALSSSYNGQILQLWGDPGSSTLQSTIANWAQGVMAANQYDGIELDDASPPSAGYWGGSMCWGTGTFSNGRYTCTAAPGGTAARPWGQGFSREEWRAGEALYSRNLPRPVMYNGLAFVELNVGKQGMPPIARVIASEANAWGGMCETCFYNNTNPYMLTSPILDQLLNGIITVTQHGKNVVIINSGVTDTTKRQQALAQIMLIYSPEQTYLYGGPCGPNSFIHACPESALTFYKPLKGYPANVPALADPGGTYYREFGACYNLGVLVGPCAAIVNPDRVNSHPMPTALHQVYSHTAEISGLGLCQCFGDTGSVDENGAAAPSVLPPDTGYVVFL